MKEQTIRLIDLTINHLEQMEIAGSRISFETLKGFVQCQVWTKKPEYQNTRYVDSIAWIAWHIHDQRTEKDVCGGGK